MSRRYLVLGLSAVLAITLAVPALGGPGNPVASTAVSAAKALKKAKKARQAASSAQSTADTALSTANQANASAQQANSAAGAADQKATAAQASANTAQATANAANANANTRFNDIIQVTGTASAYNNTATKDSTASCPQGADPSQLTGGGFAIDGADNHQITVVAAGNYGEDWRVGAEETDPIDSNWSIQARAYCASK